MSKRVKFYESNYVGTDVIKKARELLLKPDTKYGWTVTGAYGHRDVKGNIIYDPIQHDSAVAAYREVGVEYILDKQELKEKLEQYDPSFWKRHNLNKYWAQYLERDRLIAAGLYDKARQEIYTENYMSLASRVIGTADAPELQQINLNLQRLTTNEFMAVTKPSPDRDTPTTALPSIAEIYNIIGVLNDAGHYNDLLERFKTAFSEANIPWLDTTDEEISKSVDKEEDTSADIIRKYKNVYDVYYHNYIRRVNKLSTNDMYGRSYRSQIRFATKEERKNLGLTHPDVGTTTKARKELLELLHAREQRLLASGKALVYLTKNNKYYIPGVSKEIVADYLKTYYGIK